MEIATYLFLDLHTTALPEKPKGIVHITELSMIAVKRAHLLQLRPNEVPRIQYKIQMCFKPPKTLHNQGAILSGLQNSDLVDEGKFNKDTCNIINTFINSLVKPVCLVAHNGLKFDFPILQYHFKKLKVKLPDNILCTDSLYAFNEILKPQNNGIPDKKITKKNFIRGTKTFLQLKGCLFKITLPADAYKLKDIYKRVSKGVGLPENRAENQCIMIMESAITRVGDFVDWVDRNHCAFSEVPVMKMK